MGKKQDEAVFGFVLMIIVGMIVAVVAPIYWLGRFVFRRLIGNVVDGGATYKTVNDAWTRGDYDRAREALQRIAYTMVGKHVPEQDKREFTKFMTEFAKEDPLYREVMDRALPLIRSTPGMQQSKIYVGQPDHIKEQMRYVFYFANELGEIRRIKKGSSYQLYLPDYEPPLAIQDKKSPENLNEVDRKIANIKEHRRFYKPAYWQVMRTVDADEQQLKAMFNDMLIASAEGSPRKEWAVLEKYFPDGTWSWPLYQQVLLPAQKETYQEWLDEIHSASLFDFLMRYKVPELKALYTELTLSKPKYGLRKKIDIANSLIAELSEEIKNDLVKRLREKEISELPPPETPEYDGMRIRLCSKISSIAYELHRKEQRKESIELLPLWQLTVRGEHIPTECQAMNGRKLRWDDPFWDSIPCANPWCMCSIDGVFEKESVMQTIHAEKVCELMYALFMAKPWLNKPGVMTDDDAPAESEAIMFLQNMAHDTNDFGNASAAAQRIVNSLLLDFMAKVTRPSPSLQERTWLIVQSESEVSQALEVISAEIARNHPQPKLIN